MRTCLILGGARSGKSRRALEIAETCSGALHFVATAQAFDAEMAERIARHRAERDARWTTTEAPIDLPDAIAGASDGHAVLLVDCLTLWLSNLMLGGHDVDRATRSLLDQVAAPRSAMLLFVSNELGLGLVPETPLGRQFRDEQGRLNQRIAALVGRVEFVAAGLPLVLKG
ncbi:bifunctional adenosylcobinamide kinase/adenosylcobinamide-phosphate guanylyltransferase [Sphingomonas sp.]|jgi:adenosylcobinamide kinase/adenosylcobinamide-phosphate guanylyltransferase|uniref:bifunctional adenosylcobinamide kinase/adenosylcobinamide-phosphate guanylyltransferase n=1 Tax=Sphingomonas sp. TaxID=28214 RepID=UPI002ED7D63C